jgi:transforming growth factor-beta-induced protein
MLALAGLLSLAIAAPVAAKSNGPTIVDTAIAVNAANGEFDYLIEAVLATGLDGALDGKRQFTVFAPTDAAFEALFADLGVSGIDEIDPSLLTSVLLYHVAPGERFAADVVASSRIRTLNRGFLSVSTDGGVFVNDAQVIIPNVDASNGVIHVIDQVLLPA